jgi:AmmeMemoRadiSam system protein B
MKPTRPSVLAGEWYPGDREELRLMIRGFLDRVPVKETTADPVGLISPHAGYVYSGFTAAHGYRLLSGRSYDVVVILSPFHALPAGRYMVHAASAYETPLGDVPVARDLVERLASQIEVLELSREGEHSIEIQLPFLQMTLAGFSILPIMVANRSVWDVSDISGALHQILKGRKALLIASSDLHHMHSYEDLVDADAKVADALETFQMKTIRTVLEPETCSVCGKVPISIVTEVAKKMKAETLEVLYRSNSRDEYRGDYSGDYTVGYLSAVLSKKD